jgi:hypothetical protein
MDSSIQVKYDAIYIPAFLLMASLSILIQFFPANDNFIEWRLFDMKYPPLSILMYTHQQAKRNVFVRFA